MMMTATQKTIVSVDDKATMKTEESATDEELASNSCCCDAGSGGSTSSDGNKVVDFHKSVAKLEHLGKHRQYWRDILLGVNDGIISTFLLVAGVAGGGLDSTAILLTAIAGTVAGAVSMCAGEYLATKSQNEVLEGEIRVERTHVIHHRQEELQELSELLQIVGIPKEETVLRQQLLDYYDQHPDSLLKAMVALEFGVLEEEQRSPFVAGMTNLVLFVVGALPSVIPFCFAGDEQPNAGLIAAGALTVCALLLVGIIKTWATRGNCLVAAMENLVIAAVGGGVAYGVGMLFDSVVKANLDKDD